MWPRLPRVTLVVIALALSAQASPSLGGEPGTSAGKALPDKFRLPRAPGVRVDRDDATQTITVWLAEPPTDARDTRGRGIYGKVTVKNRSFSYVDVYWTLNDLVTPWTYVDTLPPHWKVKFRLPKFQSYLLAGEDASFHDGFWNWGPASLFLRKKFKWTLLP